MLIDALVTQPPLAWPQPRRDITALATTAVTTASRIIPIQVATTAVTTARPPTVTIAASQSAAAAANSIVAGTIRVAGGKTPRRAREGALNRGEH